MPRAAARGGHASSVMPQDSASPSKAGSAAAIRLVRSGHAGRRLPRGPDGSASCPRMRAHQFAQTVKLPERGARESVHEKPKQQRGRGIPPPARVRPRGLRDSTGHPGGAPSGPPAPPSAGTGPAGVSAAWLDAGRMIGIVTVGSSTCAPLAEEAAVDGQTITVSSSWPDGRPALTISCPARLRSSCLRRWTARRMSRSSSPERRKAPLSWTAPTVCSQRPTDYAPSAGWNSETEFVVLTWGSSSCAPTVRSVTVSDEHALTLTFAEFEADQVCTMDMAPRLAVAGVPDGFGDEDDVSLTLAGGGVSGTTPILGDR